MCKKELLIEKIRRYVVMNNLLCIYSLMLCMLAFFAYKNELGISITSIILVVLLTLFAGIHLFYTHIIIKIVISCLLLLISFMFFVDRWKSLKEVHLSHHIIRLVLHLVLIFNLWVV